MVSTSVGVVNNGVKRLVKPLPKHNFFRGPGIYAIVNTDMHTKQQTEKITRECHIRRTDKEGIW